MSISSCLEETLLHTFEPLGNGVASPHTEADLRAQAAGAARGTRAGADHSPRRSHSSRPELADVIDVSVFVDAPERVRRGRLEAREEAAFLEAWHARRNAAEAYYFRNVRPRESFDVIVDTATGSVLDLRSTKPRTSLLPPNPQRLPSPPRQSR
jgi:hypothetical protein